MASRKEIAITIKGNVSPKGNEKEISFSKSPINKAVSNDKTASEAQNNDYSISGGSAVVSALTVYAMNTVKNNIISAASVAWNRYVDMKEDYLAQNNMNEVKAHLGMAKSYGTSIAAGATIGAIGGPVGIAVGAAVGAASNFISRGVRYGITMANYNEQNNAMNAQTNFSRVRMGLIDGGRGTEN